MKLLKRILPVVVMACFLIGCGGGGVSEDKPISEIATEVKTMTEAQIKSVVQKYESAIAGKKKEIDAIKAKLKEIPMTQMLGEEAKTLKSEISEVTTSLKALTDRLSVYAKALEEKMQEAK